MYRLLQQRHRIAQAALSNNRGMTLVEIMIVLTIMASMMSIVGFFAVGALKNAKIKEAQTEVAQISQFIDSYYTFQEEMPDTLDDLVNPPGGMAPVTREIPLDPWRNDYQYSKTSDTEYELYCMGPDGNSGSDDDIFPSGQGQ